MKTEPVEVLYQRVIPTCPLEPTLTMEIIETGDTWKCLVDSGASMCIFPKTVGILLNVDYHRPPDELPRCAHGEKIRCWKKQIKVKIKELADEFMLTIYCSDIDGGIPLLGRESFFERYSIRFEESEKKMFISKKN